MFVKYFCDLGKFTYFALELKICKCDVSSAFLDIIGVCWHFLLKVLSVRKINPMNDFMFVISIMSISSLQKRKFQSQYQHYFNYHFVYYSENMTFRNIFCHVFVTWTFFVIYFCQKCWYLGNSHFLHFYWKYANVMFSSAFLGFIECDYIFLFNWKSFSKENEYNMIFRFLLPSCSYHCFKNEN